MTHRMGTITHSHVRHDSLLATLSFLSWYAGHDVFTGGTWPCPMWVMNAFICETWLLIWDLTHSHLGHYSLLATFSISVLVCGTFIMHMSAMTDSLENMTHSHVRHDSFTKEHDSFTRRTWLVAGDLFHFCVGTIHGGDQTSNIWISRSNDCLVKSCEWRGLRLHTWKTCTKFWGLPWKRVWYVQGLQWKLVGNFGSRHGARHALIRVPLRL